MHVGDADFDPEDPAYAMDATWGEVFSACCVKTPQDWLQSFAAFLGVCFFLYFFLVGLDFLGTGAKVMSGCAAGSLFGDDVNPIAGLMVGVLATVLLQSSSTTTSLVISLVGSGVISTKQGIYFIMGANIGTTVTNTLVSCAHLGVADELERAFAGATIHDAFNYLTVAVLLPVEVATGYLFYLTKAMVKNYEAKEGEEWEGPISKYVEPIGKYILIENKKVTEAVAKGEKSCGEFYPIVCEDMDNPTPDGCAEGLIKCDDDLGCPAFFDPRASQADDVLSGIVVFIIGIFLLFICLYFLVKVLHHMIMGASTRIIYKATNVNPYLAMVIGMGLTILVQSSSVVTSALTPLCGIGVLRLEQMFPLTLGSNIGTTITGILAALLNDANSMQVALAHTFFNITGIIIWYPIPFMRAVPLAIARFNGRATRIWRGYPFLYLFIAFFLIPLILLGISTMFTQDSKALSTLGGIVVFILFIVLAWTTYYCKYQGGSAKCRETLVKRQARSDALVNIHEEMAFLKAKVKELSEHTGLPDEEAQEAPEVNPVSKTDEPVEEEDA